MLRGMVSRFRFLAAAALVLGACRSQTPPTPPTPELPVDPRVLVGAGDIAGCDWDDDEATAQLLDKTPGTVFTLGDAAYPTGSTEALTRCYGPTWGRHLARTRPAPGNHEYYADDAAGPYFQYFGAAAGEPGRGYYSYEVASWHVVVLNSEVDASAESAQVAWLREDLTAHPARCTLAYWHRPRFSSGAHGSAPELQPLWDALYAAGAEVVLGGHDHHYERFAPQTPLGEADPERGIREFIVGTGGAPTYPIVNLLPNSEVRRAEMHGVLKLTLEEDGYRWEFLSTKGEFHDEGSGSCH